MMGRQDWETGWGCDRGTIGYVKEYTMGHGAIGDGIGGCNGGQWDRTGIAMGNVRMQCG